MGWLSLSLPRSRLWLYCRILINLNGCLLSMPLLNCPTVASTWLLSFDQIRKSEMAAAELLSFVSCIEPRGIPQSLLPSSEYFPCRARWRGCSCCRGCRDARGPAPSPSARASAGGSNRVDPTAMPRESRDAVARPHVPELDRFEAGGGRCEACRWAKVERRKCLTLAVLFDLRVGIL